MKHLIQWKSGLLHVALLIATAMGVCSCGDPPDVSPAQEFEVDCTELHRDFFSKISTFRKARSTNEAKSYEGFRNDVQSVANGFLKDLAGCKEQADADEFFNKLPLADLRTQNDARKTAMEEAVQKSPQHIALKGFENRLAKLKRTKAIILGDLQAFIDEHGEDSFDDEIETIRYHVEEGDKKLKAVEKAIKGCRTMLDDAAEDAGRCHAEVVAILDNIESTYKSWTPPPPPPFHPETILFTVETTPALYDGLLSTLIQRYKQYTFLYENEQGERCITDAKNKEGVVIRLVEPNKFSAATDSLSQGRADAVIAFRDTFDKTAYDQLEQNAAAREEDEEMSSILVTGLAYNAVLLKVNQSSELEKLDIRTIDQTLQGKTVYTDAPTSIAGELVATMESMKKVQTTVSERPEKDVMSGDGIAAVAFSRKSSAAKDVRVARIPSAEQKIYFWPRPGDIAAGRYMLSAPVNAALNPASPRNEEVRKFLDYVLSDEGQAVVKSADFVSITEYEENDEEIAHLRKMFEKEGYAVGRIITRCTFLFPKNDARISKNPEVTNRKEEFKDFDSTIRSNFSYIKRVISKKNSQKGQIAVGIIGHASSEGGESFNKPLSVNRAKYAAAHIKQGDDKRLILWDGMSSRLPVDDNKEEAGKIRNRRASAYVVEVFETGKADK